MEQPDPSRMPRILLVEDDTISQMYFTAVLESLPATVDAVATLACAQARAADTRHDLWLIDLSLPDGSGSDLLARLRERWPQTPPALAHTADADPAVRAADQQRNLEGLARRMPDLAAQLAGVELGAVAGVRAAAGDHQPVAGALGGGLFVLGGFGGRGFALAPLLAEHVAALLAGVPSPLSAAMARLVDPGRLSPASTPMAASAAALPANPSAA